MNLRCWLQRGEWSSSVDKTLRILDQRSRQSLRDISDHCTFMLVASYGCDNANTDRLLSPLELMSRATSSITTSTLVQTTSIGHDSEGKDWQLPGTIPMFRTNISHPELPFSPSCPFLQPVAIPHGHRKPQHMLACRSQSRLFLRACVLNTAVSTRQRTLAAMESLSAESQWSRSTPLWGFTQ